jgi:hypothetical protein
MGRRGREVHDGMDIIDSRDVIARIEELRDERDALADAIDELEKLPFGEQSAAIMEARAALKDWDESDSRGELESLLALQSECENVTSEWKDGVPLIRDSYFEEFAEQEAEDVGCADPKVSGRWPYNHIDWKAAAEELQQDYSQVEFGDTTYWVRN